MEFSSNVSNPFIATKGRFRIRERGGQQLRYKFGRTIAKAKVRFVYTARSIVSDARVEFGQWLFKIEREIYRKRRRERERCAMTRHAAFPCTTYDRFSMGSRTFLSSARYETTIHPRNPSSHRTIGIINLF